MGYIDRRMRRIAKMKAEAGEFSLDLYFDDLAQPQKAYVALLIYGYGSHGLKKKHFRASSFRRALNAAERFIKKLR